MGRPTWENRWSMTTILAAVNLLLFVFGGGAAYQNVKSDIRAVELVGSNLAIELADVHRMANDREARIRALELGAGRTEEKLANILAILSRIETQLERP